jgi:hypothetical protein
LNSAQDFNAFFHEKDGVAAGSKRFLRNFRDFALRKGLAG